MFEIVKKAMFTGVGLASLTREKIQDLGKDVARHADLSEAEAAKFQEELEKRADSAREDLQAEIQAEDVSKLSAKVTALTHRVEELEAKLSASQSGSGTGAGTNS